MNWYVIFYLFSITDNLATFFGWMAFIFTAINVIAWICFIEYKYRKNENQQSENEDDLRIMRKWVWYSTLPFIFFWLGYIATPSKKDMLLIIAGGSVGQFITNDPNAKKLPADITQFLHAEILKATSELTDKNVTNPEVEKIKKMSKEQLEKLVLEQLGKKDTVSTSK